MLTLLIVSRADNWNCFRRDLHVLVLHQMCQADLLRLRIEFAALSPHESVFEVRCETPVDAVTHRLDSRTLAKTDGVCQIWALSSSFRIYSATRSGVIHLGVRSLD